MRTFFIEGIPIFDDGEKWIYWFVFKAKVLKAEMKYNGEFCFSKTVCKITYKGRIIHESQFEIAAFAKKHFLELKKTYNAD